MDGSGKENARECLVRRKIKYEEEKGKVKREGWKGVPDKKDDGEKGKEDANR